MILSFKNSLSLNPYGLDLVVCPFQGPGGDQIVVLGQDATPVGHEGVSKLCEHWDI